VNIKTLFVFAAICVFAAKGEAQTRILGTLDLTNGSVAGQELRFQAAEAEVEKSFKKNRLFLSGFALGIRREAGVRKWDEGVYLTFRTFRRQKLLFGLEAIPSLTVLWGSPGTTLNRTTQERYEEFIPYTNVFPLRNAGVPKFDIEEAGLIYPEISVALRKTFLKNIFSVEPVVGVRVIRFGVIEYDGADSSYREDTALLPTVAIRFGVRVH
jgi:hypothetical protein